MGSSTWTWSRSFPDLGAEQVHSELETAPSGRVVAYDRLRISVGREQGEYGRPGAGDDRGESLGPQLLHQRIRLGHRGRPIGLVQPILGGGEQYARRARGSQRGHQQGRSSDVVR